MTTLKPVPLLRYSLFSNRNFSIVYWGTLFSFFVMKGVVRPVILSIEAPKVLDIIVLSYPNFCEAVIGSFVVVSLLQYLNQKYLNRFSGHVVLITGIAFSAVYVITQEFKIHNLGGRNIYDPWDVLFSVIGLSVAYLILLHILETGIQREISSEV